MPPSPTRTPTTSSDPHRPSTAAGRALAAVTVAVLAAGLAVPSGAAAQSATTTAKASNATRLAFDARGRRLLRQAGITLSTTRPALASRTRIALPVSGLMVENARNVTVTHKQAVSFRRGKRALRVTVPQIVVAGTTTRITGVVGTRTYPLFRVAATSRTRAIDATKGRVTFKQATVYLTTTGAKLLRQRLGVRRLAAGRVGTLVSDADVTVTGMLPFAPVDGPPTPGGAATTPKPAGAREIVGGTATWAPKTSWLGYVAQEGEGATAEDGATFVGEKTTGSYRLPVTGGWYDPATGAGVVQTSGTSRFTFTGHQIRVALQDWAFDLADTPKAVASVKEALHASILPGHDYIGTRIPLFLAKRDRAPAPTVAPDGATVTWPSVPLTLANEGVPVFLAYLYDSEQGDVSVTATLGG